MILLPAIKKLILLPLLLVCLQVYGQSIKEKQPVTLNGIAGVQLYNSYKNGLHDINPAASFLFLLPVNKFSFQYQIFVDTKAVMFHRVAVDYLIFKKRLR